MYDTNEFRKGMRIEYENALWQIVDCQHVKPGKGVAFVKTRMKNMMDGRVLDTNFRAGDKVGRPDVREVTMQVLYKDPEGWHFMETISFEQVIMTEESLGDTAQWLQENITVDVVLYNERPIGVDLPNFVELKITYCEPGFRGDTATGSTKPATLETGAIVKVPLFVEEGEVIKVDTRTGDYVSRVGR
ncbi:MAG: elongation factor P [Myxococcales bacterium]|nr:elongation factor P [Myxococcales bacterium]